MSLFAIALVVAAAAAVRGTWSPCGLSMVSAINPLAERGRGNRYWLTTCWFVLGSVLGGLLLGLAAAVPAWLASALPHRSAALIGALGCLVALAADRRVAGFRLPLHPRQVNERWLTQYRRWLYAAGFGFQIGTGFATYIMTAATYLAVLLAALTGSPGLAVLTGLVFGLVRGSAVLLAARCRTPQALRSLHRRLELLAPASLRAVILLESVAAVLLAAGLAGWAGAGTALLAAVAVLLAPRISPRLAQKSSVPQASAQPSRAPAVEQRLVVTAPH
jgi:hypothetical protein